MAQSNVGGQDLERGPWWTEQSEDGTSSRARRRVLSVSTHPAEACGEAQTAGAPQGRAGCAAARLDTGTAAPSDAPVGPAEPGSHLPGKGRRAGLQELCEEAPGAPGQAQSRTEGRHRAESDHAKTHLHGIPEEMILKLPDGGREEKRILDKQVGIGMAIRPLLDMIEAGRN